MRYIFLYAVITILVLVIQEFVLDYEKYIDLSIAILIYCNIGIAIEGHKIIKQLEDEIKKIK